MHVPLPVVQGAPSTGCAGSWQTFGCIVVRSDATFAQHDTVKQAMPDARYDQVRDAVPDELFFGFAADVLASTFRLRLRFRFFHCLLGLGSAFGTSFGAFL